MTLLIITSKAVLFKYYFVLLHAFGIQKFSIQFCYSDVDLNNGNTFCCSVVNRYAHILLLLILAI